MNELLKLTGALYDETRITILAFLLKEGECCVCELSASLGFIQSRLSRHVGIMYDAGFLSMRRHGKWVYYAVSSDIGGVRSVLVEEVRALNLSLPSKILACEIKKEYPMSKKRVLFVCVHNSARSVMAEGFLNALGGEDFEAYSAGLEPGILNADAVDTMAEVGIEVGEKVPQSAFDLFKAGRTFHYIITVCDGANAQRCPVFPGITQRIHWSFEDPSEFKDLENKEERMAKIRPIRDAIKVQIEEWIKNPGKAQLA